MKQQTIFSLIKDNCSCYDYEANSRKNHCCLNSSEENYTCVYFKDYSIRCKYLEENILPQAEVAIQQDYTQKISEKSKVTINDLKHLLELFPNMDYPELVYQRIEELKTKSAKLPKIKIGNQRKCSECNKDFISVSNANIICPTCQGAAKTKREKTKKANYRSKKRMKKL